MMSEGIRVVLVKGSVRQDSYTSMALGLVADELAATPGVTFDVVDPASLRLTLPGAPGDGEDAAAMRETIARCTGVVLATPEYHGSYSAAIKLVIENLGFPSVLAQKPVGLLGVAAGRIGAIKALEHLRSVASHVGAIVLPGPVSIANVRNVFDETGQVKDEAAAKQIRSVATNLVDYIHDNLCPRVALEAFVRGEAA